jgi:hypothetical protein
VSPKIGAAKGKPFAGYRIVGGTSMGPIYGAAVTQSTKKSLIIGFTAPRLEIGASGGGSVFQATEFHQLSFNDTESDGAWDVGEFTSDCYWYQSGGSITLPSCSTITAVDCATVIRP